MSDFYSADLADIHDVAHTDFVRAAAATLLPILRARTTENRLVIDLGCGSGVLAALLLDAGYDVLGVDISENMLEIARTRAKSAKFVRASLHDVEIPPCAAVTAIGECLNYLADAKSGAHSTISALFSRIHRALAPRGVFLFDIATPGRGGATRHIVRDDWAVISESRESAEKRELTRTITLFRAHNGAWRRTDEVHRLRLHDPAEMGELLQKAGFTVQKLDSYANSPFPPGYTAFLAEKAP